MDILASYDRVAGAAQDPSPTLVDDLVPKRWVVGPPTVPN